MEPLPQLFLHAFFSILFLLYSSATAAGTGSVGVNYGRIADNLPSPQQVVQLLKSENITKVKIFDSDSAVLSAFSSSGIAVTVSLPNELLSAAAASQSYTDDWVNTKVVPYHPETLIDVIAVGNEVFVNPKNTPFLVPAMKNVYASLLKYGLAPSVKVSSPLALSALQNSYPPSSGSFKSELVESGVKPMLSFLKRTDSYLMVNAYPFFAYIANKDTISPEYALFENNSGNVDSNNGLVYKNLLEAQIDAVYSATAKLGFPDVNLVVTETGWPSKGDQNEIGANPENAAAYNGNLVRRVLTGAGTPLRPDNPLNVYLFALFNENQKPGPTSERNYGLFFPNKQKVYDIPLTVEDLANFTNMNNGSRRQVPVPVPVPAPSPSAAGAGGNAGQTWCVANGESGELKLQAALDYACGEGGADCRPIQEGATCYNPNTLEAHASYAFNSYYQKNRRTGGTCDFGGTAYLVTQPPRFGSCEFPTGN